MKAKLVGKLNMRGFSTLEIVIALALMVTVISGAVSANIASQYWSLTSQTATEGLYKAKTVIEQLRAYASADFFSASTSALTRAATAGDPIDAPCLAGGLCYFVQSVITDISSCSKYAEAKVAWRIAERYSTSTVSLYTNLTNTAEIIASGGDCILNVPVGNWLSGTLVESGSVTMSPSLSTGLDVLQKRAYVTSSTTPQLKIFSIPTTTGQSPTLIGSSNGDDMRLNAVDAIRDVSTGRIYAYVAEHASTSQVSVFDVTDASNPALVMSRSLSGVPNTGSFPEGWRVVAYGNRLYVTTRETAGPELHIFNINAPTQPTEITSAAFELNRTVNDMLVRDQLYNGSVHRLLFLAASAGLKEFSVIDVTNDTPVEKVAIDLSGSIDARSVALVGIRVYVGRASGSGPELFQYDVPALLSGNTTPIATSETGADILSLHVAGDFLFAGTGKTGEEFQVWHSDPGTWSSTVTNAGRISALSIPRLAPLGIDMTEQYLFALTQSTTQPENLKIVSTP
jgi:hypothetical protein